MPEAAETCYGARMISKDTLGGLSANPRVDTAAHRWTASATRHLQIN